MKLIYFGMHLIHYGQVGIWDHEDKSAYPVIDGALPWWGPKGLVVPAFSVTSMPVYVYESEHYVKPPQYTPAFLTSGSIEVGREGLGVGNVTTASVERIPWPSGQVFLMAFYSGETLEVAERVGFLLTKPEL